MHAFNLWLRYAHPENLPADFYTDAYPPELRLATAVRLGAEPGLFTVDQAQTNYLAWRGRTERLIGVRDKANGRDFGDKAMNAVMALPGVAGHYEREVGLLGTRTLDPSALVEPGAGS
jgi:hypothetical protein